AEHWNGRAWHLVHTPGLGAFTDVTAISRGDVWAVGESGNGPLAEHWDGRRWHVATIRREGAFSAVDGTSPTEVWAVGAQGLTGPSVNDVMGLAMRWDGRRWREVRDTTDVGGQEGLESWGGLDVLSPSDAWGMRATGPARRAARGWRDFAV